MIYIIYWFLMPFTLFQLAKNQTFWTALAALGAVVCAAGVFLVWRQLKLSAWANAQEIFMKRDFVSARTAVLNHWEDKPPYSPPSDKKDEYAALLVCRRMDALCRLVDKRFISKDELFKVWGIPLAKSYIIIVERWKVFEKEINTCKDHRDKWESFCRIGKEAADLKYPQRPKYTK